MILINFSHEVTPEQQEQIQSEAGQSITQTIPVPVDFDNAQDYIPQLQNLMDQLPLTSKELQAEPILVILPSLNYIAALVLAELHGRRGHFPSVVRLRPVPDIIPTKYEVAEVINLQQDVREPARKRRSDDNPEAGS